MILSRTKCTLHSLLASTEETSTKQPWPSERGSNRTSRPSSHLVQFMFSMMRSRTSTNSALRRGSMLGKFPVHRVTTPRIRPSAGVVQLSPRSSQTKASLSAQAFPVDAVLPHHRHLRHHPHHPAQTDCQQTTSLVLITKSGATATVAG